MNIIKLIPNAVSLMRIPCGTLMLWYAINEEWQIAFWYLIAGIMTDVMDGFLARKLNAKSEVGQKYIDPICDLYLTIAILAGLVFTGTISWVTIYILLGIAICLWAPILFLKKDNGIRMRCEGINPPFNILTMFVCYCVYMHNAYAEYWNIGILLTMLAAFITSYTKWPGQLLWLELIIGKKKKNRIFD